MTITFSSTSGNIHGPSHYCASTSTPTYPLWHRLGVLCVAQRTSRILRSHSTKPRCAAMEYNDELVLRASPFARSSSSYISLYRCGQFHLNPTVLFLKTQSIQPHLHKLRPATNETYRGAPVYRRSHLAHLHHLPTSMGNILTSLRTGLSRLAAKQPRRSSNYKGVRPRGARRDHDIQVPEPFRPHRALSKGDVVREDWALAGTEHRAPVKR